MKPQYKLTDWGWRSSKIYSITYYGYYRCPKTFNERRQNAAAKVDGYKIRGKRSKLPTSWDDLNYSFLYKKCWKRFTKQRHQWRNK